MGSSKVLKSYNTDKIFNYFLDVEAPTEQSVSFEYSEPSEISNENEEIECVYEDGNLMFYKCGYQSVYVNELDELLNKIESLKCSLDKHFITLPEFYLEVRTAIDWYDLPF